jgi:hypothetical protein
MAKLQLSETNHRAFRVSLCDISGSAQASTTLKVSRLAICPKSLSLEVAVRIQRLALLGLLAALLCVPGALLAHHGTANYDMTKVTTLKGTVTDFQFINPHTLILFDVKNDQGVVEHWQAEATSPNHLVRAGWSKDIIKNGDEISISGFRAKNGSNVLRFQKMVLANGQEVKEGGQDN